MWFCLQKTNYSIWEIRRKKKLIEFYVFEFREWFASITLFEIIVVNEFSLVLKKKFYQMQKKCSILNIRTFSFAHISKS